MTVEDVDLDEGASFYELSGERLGVLGEADLLVVADFTVTGDAEQDGVTQFEANPLWDELAPVQAGRVVQVPGFVYNGGHHFAAKALLASLAEALR